jgi:hypothetical protein
LLFVRINTDVISDGHAFRMMREVVRMGRSGEYKHIIMNRGVNNFTGRTATPNFKPDVVGIRNGGKVDMIEVRSKWQTRNYLMTKLELIWRQLPANQQGMYRVIEYSKSTT